MTNEELIRAARYCCGEIPGREKAEIVLDYGGKFKIFMVDSVMPNAISGKLNTIDLRPPIK